MDVTITINDAQVRALMARANVGIERALDAAMTDATVLLLNQMRTYPPQRTGTTYKRTNTLKGSWSRDVQGSGSSLVGRVVSNGNAAPYNVYVQDRDQQARWHRGNWTNTAQAVAERSNDAINAMFRARVEAALAQG